MLRRSVHARAWAERFLFSGNNDGVLADFVALTFRPSFATLLRVFAEFHPFEGTSC